MTSSGSSLNEILTMHSSFWLICVFKQAIITSTETLKNFWAPSFLTPSLIFTFSRSGSSPRDVIVWNFRPNFHSNFLECRLDCHSTIDLFAHSVVHNTSSTNNSKIFLEILDFILDSHLTQFPHIQHINAKTVNHWLATLLRVLDLHKMSFVKYTRI